MRKVTTCCFSFQTRCCPDSSASAPALTLEKSFRAGQPLTDLEIIYANGVGQTLLGEQPGESSVLLDRSDHASAGGGMAGKFCLRWL